jgi:MFS family permease
MEDIMIEQSIRAKSVPGESRFAALRRFFIIWFGQLVSLTGSGLTAFALGVWVFQQTGSATSFALIALAGTLPRALFSPVAGALADRYDRRKLMIAADMGAGLSTILLIALFVSGRIELWHIYLGAFLNAAANAFQFPAYSASIPTLVPKEQLGRANGLVQLANAIGMIIAPVAAGILIATTSIPTIMIIDLATFLFAVGTLLMVRIPRGEVARADDSSFVRQVVDGWRYLRVRHALLALFGFLVLGNFLVGVAAVLLAPMVLSFSNAATLGVVQAVGGAGLLVGGILMSVWGGGQRRVYTFLGFFALLGIGVLGAGLHASAVTIGISAFVAYLSLPFIIGTLGAILNSKVAPNFQGRVVSLRVTAVTLAFALAYATAGPLADRVFEPLLLPGGALASSVGQVIGTGDGRGMAALFILMGALAIAAVGLAMPRLRNLDSELPDAV